MHRVRKINIEKSNTVLTTLHHDTAVPPELCGAFLLVDGKHL